MTKRIRIIDIAEKTGVSIGTVDRVLHNRGHVNPDVRQRVLDVMGEMGYEPNIIARTLAQNKAHRIVALLPNFHNDPYWVQPKEGCEKAAQAVKHYGVSVDFVFFDMFNPADFEKKGRKVVEQSPDAVLLPPLLLRESLRLIEEMSEKNIANVLINTNLDSKNSLSYIGQDSYQSGVLAARLLDFGLADGDHALVLNLDKGVTNAQHLMDKERGFKTYFSGLKGKNIEIHAAIFEEFDSPGKLKSWVSGFLEQCPKLNGIFVTNSRAWVLAAAMNPETLKKLKIVGFDLIEENLELLRGEQIDFLLNQNAWYQGYLGIMTIVNKLILKKEIPPTQFLPLDIVVKENVGYYLSRTLELPTMVM